MKRIALLLLLAVAACDSSKPLDPDVRERKSLLAAARDATARYQDINNALADGFVDIDVYMPNMGWHFLKPDRLDGTFKADEPEILVYDKDANGRYALVAVEYAIPRPMSATAPEGFPGAEDAWDENLTFDLWTLHAWVWLQNPTGVFAPHNPLVR